MKVSQTALISGHHAWSKWDVYIEATLFLPLLLSLPCTSVLLPGCEMLCSAVLGAAPMVLHQLELVSLPLV